MQANALFQRAMQWHQQGRLAEAGQLYAQVVSLNPRHADAWHLRGMVFAQLGEPSQALPLVDKALQLQPQNAAMHNTRGNVLLELDRLDEALASYARALALQPAYPEALYNQGNVLKRLDRLDEALASYDRALALRADYAQAYCNRGIVLHRLGRFAAARADYDRALALEPQLAEAYSNRANALMALHQLPAALHDCDTALALRPDYADAHDNRGSVLQDLRRHAEALASHDRALELAPRDADVHLHRGHALKELGRLDEALASFRAAAELAPDRGDHFAVWLSTRMLACDWAKFDDEVATLERLIRADRRDAPTPFAVLSLIDAPDLHRMCARAWAREHCPVATPAPAAGSPADGRIRIGYFSADFHTHATTFLMARLFEVHDKARFELIAFSFGPPIDDAMRRRVVAAFDRFVDVSDLTDAEVASLSREWHVDVAVDLKGFTKDARPGIFAHRAAAVQVQYLGYPGTMGVPYIDYVVADATVIPPPERAWYDEKVVWLPHSYQVNDPTRAIAEATPTREAVGLPAEGFVFCCFNNNYKIVPAVFDAWMRILQRVPGSVLWLLEDNALAAANLRREAVARGVDPQRLVFAPRAPLPEHLARHRLADLFLDTAPYNAHTTASDALWGGLPLLTCMGRSFASRVGASLLRAVGLPELVTESWADYEALAVALATDRRGELDALRARLAANRLTAPLFDAERFARHLEAAYVAMVERQRAGLPPAHLDVHDDATVVVADGPGESG
jgi:predicted O-linked N-acetylglucosamine transferase (SPINDLY family)